MRIASLFIAAILAPFLHRLHQQESGWFGKFFIYNDYIISAFLHAFSIRRNTEPLTK